MHDPLHDIHHYGKTLTIAQVLKFFQKKECNITRAMIQNYIRDGLLPPPVNKRFYTHKHLAALVVIDYLKNVFEISDIKTALGPHMDEEGLPLESYAELIRALENITAYWKAQIGALFTENGALALMAHTADLQKMARNMIG